MDHLTQRLMVEYNELFWMVIKINQYLTISFCPQLHLQHEIQNSPILKVIFFLEFESSSLTSLALFYCSLNRLH